MFELELRDDAMHCIATALFCYFGKIGPLSRTQLWMDYILDLL